MMWNLFMLILGILLFFVFGFIRKIIVILFLMRRCRVWSVWWYWLILGFFCLISRALFLLMVIICKWGSISFLIIFWLGCCLKSVLFCLMGRIFCLCFMVWIVVFIWCCIIILLIRKLLCLLFVMVLFFF